MLRQPRYVIAVHDLAVSARYYRDVLGFEVHEIGDPGWRFFVRDECFIMAGECREAMPVSQLGDHSYIAYVLVDDVDAFYDEITARGAKAAPPADKPWQMREFALRTVDGHGITFGAPLRA